MNNTTATDDDSPGRWIKKQSKSRPNHSYYYNTVTRQSQWTSPVSSGDKHRKQLQNKGDKALAESPRKSDRNDGKSLKISNSSKQIKKSQTKTPAQDRLQDFARQLKNTSPTKVRARNVAEQLKSATPGQYRPQNLGRKNRNEFDNKSSVAKKTNGTTDVNKSKLRDFQNVKTPVNDRAATLCASHTSSVNVTTAPDASDEIPSLFPPRTPGQNRLNRLRDSLNPGDGNTTSESSQHALSVIQSEFGLSPGTRSPNLSNHNTTIDEDEPMDWEPCDIFEQVENVVYTECKRAYIVPDTNVFLDELSCISGTILRDGKYNVLVPFVVLQELDRLKGRAGDSRISNLASAAIRFIFNELKSKKQRLQGQKATEDCSHLIDVANADDKILNCCLQLLHQSCEATLISNDINLCNKAIASGVPTMTSKEYKAKHN